MTSKSIIINYNNFFFYRFPPEAKNEWLVGLNNIWKPYLTEK